jgi:hypothetical protein
MTSRARRAGGVVPRAREEVEGVPDRRERVPELVRQDPQELVLAPIRLLEPLRNRATALLALLARLLRRLLGGEVDDERRQAVRLAGGADEKRHAGAVRPDAFGVMARTERGVQELGDRAPLEPEPLGLELLAGATDDPQVLLVRELGGAIGPDEQDPDRSVAREPLEPGRLRLERGHPKLLREQVGAGESVHARGWRAPPGGSSHRSDNPLGAPALEWARRRPAAYHWPR